MTVCTPPAENVASPPCIIAGITSAKRKHQDEELPQEHFRTMRRQTRIVARETTLDIASAVDDLPIMDVVSIARPSTCGTIPENRITPTRKWIASGAIDLDGLPYFQFRRLMRSPGKLKINSNFSTEADFPDVVNGFEKMLSVKDTLVEKPIGNYWALPSPLQHSNSYTHSLELHPTVCDSGTSDEFESLDAYLPMQNSPLFLYKPLGIELLFADYSPKDSDIVEWSQKAQKIILALLAGMPQIPDDDFQQRIDLLFGPPTVESVRYVVEVGVYLSSNNINCERFIEWMLRIVPWAVLKPILSTPISAIQAFAESVLHVATSNENVRVVKDLLQTPGLTRLLRSSGNILSGAVLTSNAELVRLLLHAGARADQDPDTLVYADTVEIAQMLVEAGADVNDKEVADTALCEAVKSHDVKLARYLIGAGADVNLPSSSSHPLAVAARANQTELLGLLLEHGAHVNQVEYGTDALQVAAMSGNLDCVRLLVEAGADVNAPAYNHHGRTALQAASYRGHLEVVSFLLDRGANVDAPGNFDHQFPKTVLTTAVEENHLKLVRLLLNAGADVNMPSFGYYGCTALEAAKSRPASSDIVNLLIAKGAHDAALLLGPHRMIELREAVCEKDLGRVQFLANLGVRIDMQLIELSPGYSSFKKSTILHWALGYEDSSNVELFRFLIDKIEDVNAQNENPDVEPILTSAASGNHIEAVKILVGAGADVNVNHGKYKTPLIAATLRRSCEIVRFLWSKGADVNAIVKDCYVTTALQASLHERRIDMFYFLLAKGARINAPIGPRGCSELAGAAGMGSIEVVRELLDRGAEVNSAPGNYKQTALQAAASATNMAIVQLLLEKGADVNAPAASHGFTALSTAVAHGHFPLVLLLLEAGADINARSPKADVETALGTAAHRGRLDMVYFLLKAGADMDLPIEERYVEATEIAREQGHIVIAEVLEGWDKGGDAQDDQESWAQNSQGEKRFTELN